MAIITDPGFELPDLGIGNQQYRPNGSPWAFAGGAGVAANSSGFTALNPAAPQGVQVAFLQSSSQVSQTVAGWTAGSYRVTFQAAQRNFGGSVQSVSVLIDGVVITSITPAGTTYGFYYTGPFDVTTGDHVIAFEGTATADYTAFIDLVAIVPASSVVPTVTTTPYVATSGKIIAFYPFTPDAGGENSTPVSVINVPTLTVNGTNHGPLEKPWLSGHHQCLLFSTPDGYQIHSGDTVVVSAIDNWCATTAGSVHALSGMIANRAGRSSVGSDTATRTLRMGVNHPLAPTSSGLGYYFPLKNFRYRIDAWPPTSHGKIATNISRVVAKSDGSNSIDSTNYPGVTGKWLVMWDAGNPASPTIITLTTGVPACTAVTQHPELSSDGVAGVGMCRVADFQHVSPTGTANIEVEVNFNDPSGTPDYSNLWVVPPGDWDIVDGAVVLDRSDPWALSRIHVDRLGDVGTVRWVDSSACSGNPVSFPYPELLNSGTDETWGEMSERRIQYGFTAVGPVDPAVTPWIYSAFFRQNGQTFTATLSENITTTPAIGTTEIFTFSDAATAPLMAGLEIRIDSEVMRIIAVSGTSVTLYRGSNGTTPATHAAGTVTVFGRKPVTSVVSSGGAVNGNLVWQLTTATPHGITSGQGFNMDGWTGPAGSDGNLTWNDGTTANPAGLVRESWVTGPNTLFTKVGLFSDGHTAVLTSTQVLDPATNYSRMVYGGAIPYEVIASASGRFPHASVHINVPMDACDDMVYHIARLVLANFPSGRKVYDEYMNEPWNFVFSGFGYVLNTGSQFMPDWPVMWGGQVNALAYYVYRAAQVHAIFRSVFAAAGRGSEIMGLLNLQLGVDPGYYLQYAAAQGLQVDAIAIAPYLYMEQTEYTSSVVNGYDDEQVIDMWTHELYYNTIGYSALAKTARDGIAAYNSATGNHCVLMGYEGGAEIIPPRLTSCVHWNERNHDLLYNPNWYIAEQDFYYWLQTNGFTALHIYSLSQYWNPQAWGMYHGVAQAHGRGDGSDGKANNLLFRANPDAANYKGSSVCQDDRCVSVRGQAFIDWNASLGLTVATAYTLTTPTPDNGQVNVASGNFIVAPNGTYNSTITISLSGGGLSTPIVLRWNNSAVAQTFSIRPTTSGTVILRPSNAGGLADHAPVTYIATATTLPPPATARMPWLGSWFGRWFITSSSFRRSTPPATPARSMLDRTSAVRLVPPGSRHEGWPRRSRAGGLRGPR